MIHVRLPGHTPNAGRVRRVRRVSATTPLVIAPEQSPRVIALRKADRIADRGDTRVRPQRTASGTLQAPTTGSLEAMLRDVDAVLMNDMKQGDQVVVICGYPVGAMGAPNMALLHTVGEA